MSALERPVGVLHEPPGLATGAPVAPSVAREEVEDRIADWIARARAWARDELPQFNMALLDRPQDAERLAAKLQPFVRELVDLPPALLARTPPRLTRDVLKVLGFFACSMERHTQARGDAAGAGLALVPGLEDALATSSTSAALPPTLGYDGYWISNTDEPLTFTGDPQEAYFRDQVVAIDDLHSRAAELIRPIAAGEIAIGDPATAARLEAAAEKQVEVHDRYAGFRTVGRAAREHFTVTYFRDVMRTFLVAFPVHGTTFHGPNAANIASQAALDYVGGIVEPFYVDHVRERMTYMSERERTRVIADMTSPSVLDRLLDALGTTPAQALGAALPDLAQRVAANAELVEPLTAFAQFRRAAGTAAGAHFGLIVHYLIKSDPEGDARRPVDAGHGTGGRTHEETKRVMRMRQREPVSGALTAAVDAVVGQPGAVGDRR